MRVLVLLGLVALIGCNPNQPTPITPPVPPSPSTPPGPPAPPPSSSSALTPGPIVFPDGFMKSVKDYGAKGDGTSDDTAAIQAALDDGRSQNQDYYGRPKAIFFPTGTYLVSAGLSWRGCCVTLQGQGSGSSTIRLKDSAFTDPSSPKPVIQTIAGNMAFRNNIWDLAISTGRNNPGAVALDFIASNTGSIRNVSLYSEDGQGLRGLDMTRQWPGPLLVENMMVTGFDYGIHVKHGEYGPTFENIYLKNQNKAGILNEGNTLAIRGLESINGVPAIQNPASNGSILLLDAKLDGGSGGSAIENGGYLYARNITSSGYTSAVKNGSSILPGSSLTEYVSGKTLSLFSSAPEPKSLGLQIKNTPSYADTNLTQWAKFSPKYYGDTGGLQALFDSGKSTIYFPFGGYFSYDGSVTPSQVYVSTYRSDAANWKPTDPWFNQKRPMTSAGSLSEVQASGGDKYWRDTANNLVWVKFKGGIANPNHDQDVVSDPTGDSALYGTLNLVIYP